MWPGVGPGLLQTQSASVAKEGALTPFDKEKGQARRTNAAINHVDDALELHALKFCEVETFSKTLTTRVRMLNSQRGYMLIDEYGKEPVSAGAIGAPRYAKIETRVFFGEAELLERKRNASASLFSSEVFEQRALPCPQRKSEDPRAAAVSDPCESFEIFAELLIHVLLPYSFPSFGQICGV